MERIEKIMMECPYCDEKHELSIITSKARTIINEKEVEYDRTIYYCPVEEESFVDNKLMKQNLASSLDAYKKDNLLNSSEIKSIRSRFGLSQKEFSHLLGWGENTVQRYETKSIQDETYDQKMRMVDENPKFALSELERHKDKFSQEKYNEVKSNLMALIKTKSAKYFNRELIESLYIEYKEPSIVNGFKTLDLNKIENIILFFSSYSERLYKVKLMKLLWYVDSIHFKRHGVGMSGLIYKHMPLGAVPQGHEDLLRYCSDKIEIKEDLINDNISYMILPKDNIDLNNFSIDEINILNDVNNKFKAMGSRQISDYMHEEIAYKETTNNEIIPYSLSTQLKDF